MNEFRPVPGLTPVSVDYDIEYEIEKRITLFLRSVFEKDSQFQYNKDETRSGLIITTDYPDIQAAPLSIPHIVITGISHRMNPQQFYLNNFYRDVFINDVLCYEEHEHLWQYSVTLSCMAQSSSLCKDLSGRVQRYLGAYYHMYFSELQNLNISSDIAKGNVVATQQHPHRVFECALAFQGAMEIRTRLQYQDFLIHRKNVTPGLPVQDIGINVEVGDSCKK